MQRHAPRAGQGWLRCIRAVTEVKASPLWSSASSDLLRSFDGTTIAGMLNDLESGHERLKEICGEIGYRNGPIEATVWSGFSSMHEVQNYLEEMRLRSLFGAPVRPLIVEEGTFAKVRVPPGLEGLVSTGTLQDIMKVLHTRERYIAAYPAPVSLGNSGRLSRAVAQYLTDKYPDRFVLHEKSPVVKTTLDGAVKVHANGHTVTAQIAVLCTNGYPLPEFESAERPKVASTLRRYVASMVAHESEEKKGAGAYIYYHDDGDPEEEPYFYLTRRSFLVNGKDLVTVGGPQQQISEELDHQSEYPEGIYQRIEGFLDRSYPGEAGWADGMRWNGLMGYTADGTRMIGPDPRSLASGTTWDATVSDSCTRSSVERMVAERSKGCGEKFTGMA